MRILIICNERPNPDNCIGGLGHQLKCIIEALSEEHIVKVVGAIGLPFPNVEYITPINFGPIKPNLHELIQSEISILYTILTLNYIPDLIMYADLFTFEAAKCLKHKFPDTTIVFLFSLSHGFANLFSHKFSGNSETPIPEEVNYMIRKEMESIQFADHIIVNSNWIYSFFPPIKPVTVIPNAVDLELIKRTPPTSVVYGTTFGDRHLNKPKIGYLQRLAGNKGLNLLLNCNNFPADLIIMGASENVEDDKRVADVCAQKGFIYLGKINGPEKYAITKTTDFMIFPNVHDPFCISALECIACGVIPIYNDIPGMGEVLKSAGVEIGVRMNLRAGGIEAVSQIEDAVRQAISLSADEKAVLRENGKVLIEKFSDWRKVGKEYKNFVKSLDKYVLN
jgi:glycosyltransferase involved in cell wall biosynthesis